MAYCTTTANAQSPFDILFPEEEERVSSGEEFELGQDDLLLVGLFLKELRLSESTSAYMTDTGLCLVWNELIQALEFPIQMSEDEQSAEGWFISQDREIRVDFSLLKYSINARVQTLDDTQVYPIGEGWCVGLEALSQMFPIAFRYKSSELRVVLMPTEVLPLEAQIEREQLRKTLIKGNDKQQDVVALENYYTHLSWPVADVTLTSEWLSDGENTTDVGFEAVLDFFKTSAHVRTTNQGNGLMENTRVTLFREGLALGQKRFAQDTVLAMGDISTPPIPLVAKGKTGRGITITNRHHSSLDVFDRTEIRGPMPQGWEAELYLDETLFAFQVEPDLNGDYVFSDIPLKPGYNRISVVLIGPHGETETRLYKYVVGAEMIPVGETSYRAGYLQENTSLLGVDADDESEESDTGIGQALRASRGQVSFVSVERGISERLSVRSDAVWRRNEDGTTDEFLTGNAFVSVAGGYGSLRAAASGEGGSTYEVYYQRRVRSNSSVFVQHTEGDILFEQRPDQKQKRKVTTVRVDSRITTGKSSIPLQVSASSVEDINGNTSLAVVQKASAVIGRVRATNSVQYVEVGGASATRGELLLSGYVGDTKLRSEVSYNVQSFEFDRYSVSAQQRLKDQSSLQYGLNYDAANGVARANVNWSKKFRKFTTQVAFEADDKGEWGLKLGHSFSFYRDADKRRYKLAPPGSTRSASVRANIYLDSNGNNMRDPDEVGMPGAQVTFSGIPSLESAGDDGWVYIPGVSAEREVVAELRRSSIRDFYSRPAGKPQQVKLRPGQTFEMDFPLVPVGEVEGSVVLVQGEHLAPLATVKVQILDRSGAVVAETWSEYDGYFYVADLPLGEYRARIAPESLNDTGTSASVISFEVTGKQRSVQDITLKVLNEAT